MILKSVLFFLLLVFSSGTFAQDLYAKENNFLAFAYQQKELKLVDHEGDHLLIWSISQIPKFVVSSIRDKENEILEAREQKLEELLEKYPDWRPLPDTENVVVEDYVTYKSQHRPVRIEGKKPPFTVEKMSLMFKQVITDEYQNNGIEPSFGTVHKWSKSGKDKLKKLSLKTVQMTKLLVALARGVTSQYIISGTEKELKKYLISRETESVTLEEMFRASYRINKGNVYLTILTIESVLSQHWIHPQRSRLLITTKLRDITNYNYAADKFGAWYHFFGIMLYGYAEGGTRAQMVGRIETLGGSIMSKFEDEWQEEYINKKAGKVGGQLRKFIKKKQYLNFKSDAQYLDEKFYLDLSEDFSDRLDFVPEEPIVTNSDQME